MTPEDNVYARRMLTHANALTLESLVKALQEDLEGNFAVAEQHYAAKDSWDRVANQYRRELGLPEFGNPTE